MRTTVVCYDYAPLDSPHGCVSEIESMKPYCIGCGEQKRLTWPVPERIFCSKTCAANAAFYRCNDPAFHCSVCGNIGCSRDHDRDD